ncbi:hypothetical protein [Sphingomonas xanthus]|uniref:Lipoprotein n=1 Tax=Sphingomonas xanthus TaxID=2594473 RepID=A0A516IST5_9SPHN|nr:hypothetical protein [Sphingomonas xanthus]QDP19950.1 hypothetical protein FMM02_08270 [Sphingomonas xanthus]
MKPVITGLTAIALFGSLAACGGTDQPAENLTANDVNAMMAPPELPAVNDIMADPVTEAEPAAETQTPAAPAPAAKPTPTKPVPAAPKPKPAEPAEDPHAGHDMNNM